MKLKLLFAIVSFLLTGFNSSLIAQLDSFKLADYKLPDLKRHGIDISYDMSGNNSRSEYKDENRISKRLEFDNELDLNYSLYRNTRKYQGEHSIVSGGSYLIRTYDHQDSDSKNVNAFGDLGVATQNRVYFTNNWFVGIGAGFGVYGEYHLDETNGSNYPEFEKLKKFKSVSTRASFSFGKGRIEPIEDAGHALYILKDLRKKNQLKREPTNEEILQISSEISRIKNERVLDARLKKIYELSKIDSILHDMDIIVESDITYFSSMNDMWEFGGLQNRSSGSRIGINYAPYFRYGWVDFFYEFRDLRIDSMYNEQYDEVYKYIYNYFYLNYYYTKPVTQKTQLSIDVDMSYIHNSNDYRKTYDEYNGSYDNEDIKHRLSLRGGCYLGFYPNTRSVFKVGSSGTISRNWTDYPNQDIENDYDAMVYNVSIYTNINYYFSPNLRLNLYYGIRANWQEGLNNASMNTNSLSNYFNLALLYSIF